MHLGYLGRPVYAEAFALTPVLILSTLEVIYGGALGWPLRVCRDLILPCSISILIRIATWLLF
jgi:hypothetical protein